MLHFKYFAIFITSFDIRHLGTSAISALPHQSPRARGLAAGQMGQSKSRPFSPFRLPSCFRLRIGHKEVAEHKEESDCWVIIGDLVLDLSKYVAKHPGGKQSILNLAGGDATEIFDLVHHRSILKKHGLQEGTITLKGVVSGWNFQQIGVLCSYAVLRIWPCIVLAVLPEILAGTPSDETCSCTKLSRLLLPKWSCAQTLESLFFEWGAGRRK